MKKLILLILLTHTLYAQNLKPVTLQLSWFDQFQFAGYYMAKEKGFYEELGLDVTIKPFEFGIDIPQRISDGEDDFAIGRETLILDRANDKKIVSLFALFQASPLVLLSTKESGIKTVEDFSNKRVMSTIDDAGEVSIKAMIKSNNIDLEGLEFLKHTHNINDLIDKKTDLISAYSSKSPYHLRKMKVDYHSFSPKDHGFDMYSDLLFTSESLIQNDRDMVIKFKKASLKGWDYAYNNIQESVDLILNQYNSQKLSKEELFFEANELKRLSYYQTSQLGQIELPKLQRIHDLYNVMGLLPKKINIHDFLFNESDFLSQLSATEKEYISQNSIIKVGVENNIRPVSYSDEVGLHKGILNDYLTLISQKTGLHFVFQIEAMPSLKERFTYQNIDLLVSATQQEFRNSLQTHPYFDLQYRLFELKDSSNKAAKKIGVLRSSNDIIERLEQKYIKDTFINFDNTQELINALALREVDRIFAPKELILPYIREHDLSDISFCDDPFSLKVPLSMTTSLHNTTLHSIILKALDNVSEEQHRSIYNKWVPLMFVKEHNWTRTLLIATALLLIIAYMTYKQIMLKRVTNELKQSQNDLLKLNSELEELSQKDHLTKLYNRRYFEEIGNKYLQLAKRERLPVALLIFDVDDFKSINDQYGHKAGDIALKLLSQLLKEFSRQSDIIARFGGEEFVILLPNTNLEGAKHFGESLREKIEQSSIRIEPHELKLTVSMGLTLCKEKESLYDTVHRADMNLYASKRNGKNQLTFS